MTIRLTDFEKRQLEQEAKRMVCSRSPLAWPTAKGRLRRSYRKNKEALITKI
ncbi:hypothetical protein [Moorena producens]|uniref:hypothetical protein n=1 Tax=Moorena producens TaxID=1155739 RepID=UPI001314F6DA|nr:hypothetical protein [Moorena producens]